MQTPKKCIPRNSSCQHEHASTTLSHLAVLANILAKHLRGHRAQKLAYQVKTTLCDLLIVSGNAEVDSVSIDGAIVGVTLDGDRPRRLHIPRNRFSRKASAIVNKQIRNLEVS